LQPDPAPGYNYPDLKWLAEENQSGSFATRMAQRLHETDTKGHLEQRVQGQRQAKEIARMYEERSARILERDTAAVRKQKEYEERKLNRQKAYEEKVKMREEARKAYEERVNLREERQKEYDARAKAREERQKEYEARVKAREEQQKVYEERVKERKARQPALQVSPTGTEGRGDTALSHSQGSPHRSSRSRQMGDAGGRRVQVPQGIGRGGERNNMAADKGDIFRSPVVKVFGGTDLIDLFRVPKTENLADTTIPTAIVDFTQATVPPVSEYTEGVGTTQVAQVVEGSSIETAPSVDVAASDLSLPIDTNPSVPHSLSEANSFPTQAAIITTQSQRKRRPLISSRRDRVTTVRHSLRTVGGDYSGHLPSKLAERGGDFRKLGPLNYARFTLARRRDVNLRSRLVFAGIVSASAKTQGQALKTTS
jgi:hypothetical protein